MFKKNNWAILVILALAAFFRFYKFFEFQYFSGDEEFLAATIRHIIWDRSPTLLVGNANLGFGLGPFYHYLLTPFYFIFKFDLINLQAIASCLGIATTYIIYLAGKEIDGKKLGLTAAFIYAASFFIALFDRRLVHLTLNPIMTAMTLFGLIKVVKKDYRYIPLLAVPIGFAFHEDASLLVLAIAIGLTWIVYRLPLKNKYVLFGGLILLVFAAPIIAAEFYYHGAVSGPLLQSLLRPFNQEFSAQAIALYNPLEMINTFARVLLTAPSQFIEQHFCYCQPPMALFTPIGQIIIGLAFVTSWFTRKRPGSIVWIMFLSLIISVYFYNQIFKANFFQHYLMNFFPVLAVILAQAVLVWQKKLPVLTYGLLSIYLIINLVTLQQSAVKYPLIEKINLVKQSTEAIGNDTYSIESSDDGYIHGGGWTELYTLYFRPANKSYHYDFWGWIYAAYSLYPPMPVGNPAKTVSIYRQGETPNLSKELIKSYSFKDIKIDIFQNE